MKTVFELREHLTALERDWLTGCLVSKGAVQGVICSDEDPHRLAIEYEECLDRTDLLDLLYLCGLHGIEQVE